MQRSIKEDWGMNRKIANNIPGLGGMMDMFSGKSKKCGFRARASERLIVGARNFCGVFLMSEGRF